MPPDGAPNAGLWRHSFPVSGCGNDTTLNLFFTAAADERITTIFGIPGTTRTDPVLQQDGIAQADAAATLV